jgi:hypothetical protein
VILAAAIPTAREGPENPGAPAHPGMVSCNGIEERVRLKSRDLLETMTGSRLQG